MSHNKNTFVKDSDQKAFLKLRSGQFTWWDSMECAMSGLRFLFCSERNFRIHLAIALSVLLAGWLLKLETLEWALLIMMIGLMLAVEALNTAIERVVDLACDKKFHQLARTAKDISAGACLMMACTSVAFGLILFLPKLIRYISEGFVL